MRIEVIRIYTFDEDQICEFMESRGYDIEATDYTFEDVISELNNAEAFELDAYGDCDKFLGHDYEVYND